MSLHFEEFFRGANHSAQVLIVISDIIEGQGIVLGPGPICSIMHRSMSITSYTSCILRLADNTICPSMIMIQTSNFNSCK